MRPTPTRVGPSREALDSVDPFGDDATSPRSHRRIAIAAAVLVPIVLVAVALAIIGRSHDGPSLSHLPEIAPPSTSALTAVPPSRQPGAAATTPVIVLPTSAPAGVTWQLFQGVALPFSSTDGPLRIDGPVFAGYTDTPVGALLASQQISYRYLITPGTGWRPVVEQQLTAGPARDAFVVAREHLAHASPPVGGLAQVAGFRFVTFDPSTAVIDIADRSPAGDLASLDITMRWLAGDWKLELPTGVSGQQRPLADLSGYVAWQGVSQ